MVCYPNAKINLGLNVVAKREDGFHDIESVFYPIPIHDILEIKKNTVQKDRFFSSGITIPGDGKSNLVMQAIGLLRENANFPNLDVHLHKQIPIGAGLGGGSADASFALKLVNNLFELGHSESHLESLALILGSDCPFFVKNKPVVAQGRGEEFSPIELNLKGKYLVLVYPSIHVSTALAYSRVQPAKPEKSVKSILQMEVRSWKEDLKNDFENSVFHEFPLIKALKEHLYNGGAEYASMSGSGSSVFGIFEEKPQLDLTNFGQSWTVQL